MSTYNLTDQTIAIGLANIANSMLDTKPSHQESGTFSLFADASWQSTSRNLYVSDYFEKERQSVANTYLQDKATWVSFNLPVGIVVTLMENVTTLQEGQSVGDLSGAGRCIDLIGTGDVISIDLNAYGMNDRVSCWFWRKVDFSNGSVQLYTDPNYFGIRNVLFFCEWASSSIYSIDGWHMNNRLSSIKWPYLNPCQEVTFYSNADGS
jgi:hypothetical protein